jgi:hypothetical protein
MKRKIFNHIRLKIFISVLVYLVTGLSLFSQPGKRLVIGEQPVYKVSRAREPVTVDGKMDEASWKNAEVMSFNEFQNIYRPKAGVRWAFQAVRQDRNYVDDRFRSTSTLFPIYDYRLDVHQPSRFGLLEFTDN